MAGIFLLGIQQPYCPTSSLPGEGAGISVAEACLGSHVGIISPEMTPSRNVIATVVVSLIVILGSDTCLMPQPALPLTATIHPMPIEFFQPMLSKGTNFC